MPNHVTNNIVIQGDETKIRKILASIQNDEVGIGSISFEKIVPMPDFIYRGELRPEDFLKYGKDNWYTWRMTNWGTKWDAYGFDMFSYHHGDWTLQFQTAWAAPHLVIEKLALMHPDCTFQHEWADEDLGQNCGSREYKNGVLVSEYRPMSGDAIRFAADVIGIAPESLEFEEDTELTL